MIAGLCAQGDGIPFEKGGAIGGADDGDRRWVVALTGRGDWVEQDRVVGLIRCPQLSDANNLSSVIDCPRGSENPVGGRWNESVQVKHPVRFPEKCASLGVCVFVVADHEIGVIDSIGETVKATQRAKASHHGGLIDKSVLRAGGRGGLADDRALVVDSPGLAVIAAQRAQRLHPVL